MSDFHLHTQERELDDVTRSLPHSVGCEKAVLSVILQDPDEYVPRAIEEGITPRHFYLAALSELYDVVLTRYAAGKPIELVSLVQVLLDTGKLEKCGGAGGVTDIYSYQPAPGYFAIHCKEIKDKFILREMIRSSNNTVAAAYDSPENPTEILDEAERSILAIREAGKKDEEQSNKSALLQINKELEAIVTGKSDLITGIKTGYEVLDQYSGGLKPGEVFIVAARPSMGKTSFMMNMIENICIDQNKPSFVVSAEMSKVQLLDRLVYARSKFVKSKLKRGYKPTKQEIERIQKANTEIESSKLLICDKAGITINELRAKARRYKREHKIEVIAIDYLQLLRSLSKQAQNSREREIAEISAGIKGIAKELNCAVIMLAQLNRDSEKRTGKARGRPQMSDLRESGSIEQDADLIGFLTRAEYYAITQEEKDALAGKAELILAKNRNGETGSIPLTFIKELMRFESGAPFEEEAPPAQNNQKRLGFD